MLCSFLTNSNETWPILNFEVVTSLLNSVHNDTNFSGKSQLQKIQSNSNPQATTGVLDTAADIDWTPVGRSLGGRNDLHSRRMQRISIRAIRNGLRWFYMQLAAYHWQFSFKIPLIYPSIKVQHKIWIFCLEDKPDRVCVCTLQEAFMFPIGRSLSYIFNFTNFNTNYIKSLIFMQEDNINILDAFGVLRNH